MMPEGGAEARGEQVAALKVVCHELLSDPALPDLLAGADAENTLDAGSAPICARCGGTGCTRPRCRPIWSRPRPRPSARARWCGAGAAGERFRRASCRRCERLLALMREVASAKAAQLGKTPYEALLDEYEPDGSTAAIDRLFDPLAAVLPGLIDEALARQARAPQPVAPAGPFPIAAQRAAGLKLMEQLGFDFAHGRLDVSLHPFCGGSPDDVRITTRYDEADFTRALMGVLHETGHALYERGLPARGGASRSASARGMSMHESQSLLDRDAGLPLARVPRVRRAAPARRLRRRRRGVGRGQSLSPLHPGRAQPHPRRCRRSDLPGACHPALSAGAGADRRRARSRRSCRKHGTRACARSSASRRPTTASAACRTPLV